MSNEIPFDSLLEQQIIGTMLTHPESIADIAPIVKSGDFYHKQHQLIYQELVRLYNEDPKRANFIEIVPFLEKNGMNVKKVHEWTDVIAPSAVEKHAERLKLLATVRRLVQAGLEISRFGHLKTREEIEKALISAESKIADIVDPLTGGETLTNMPQAIHRFRDFFNQIYQDKRPIAGIPSNFPDVDAITGGFKKGELTILAGRPGMGKTAFALQLALNMRKAKYKGLFFELEMHETQLMQRILASFANVDSKGLQNGMVTAEEYQKIMDSMEQLETTMDGLYIDTGADRSVFQMVALARKLKRKGELDFLIVDYLSLLQAPGSSMYEIVTNISRQLKRLARMLDIPVIALSQLSRRVEERSDKRPMLSDLRESGAIEQDADVVIFLYRDDYYNEESDKQNIVEVSIAKNRNGSVGKAELLFMRTYNKFLNLESVHELPPVLKKEEKTEALQEESNKVAEPSWWDGDLG